MNGKNESNESKTEDTSETALKIGRKNGVDRCYFCKKPGHQNILCEKFKVWKADKNKQPKLTKKQKANTVIQDDDKAEKWAFWIGNMKKHEVKWILDSGGACHIENRREFFASFD